MHLSRSAICSLYSSVIVMLLLCCFGIAIAQSAEKHSRDIKLVKPSQPPQLDKTKLALVIGNSDYQNINPLYNPKNDAQDIATALKRVGFEVILEHNSDHRTMAHAVERFGSRLKQSQGVGLFYYAGHGIQVSGKNYLLPVNAKIRKPSDVAFETLDLSRVLEQMAQAHKGMNIVILDACRDNPFKGSFRQINRGLAQVTAPSGTFLAYATAPGSVAADGSGRNGIYTKHILKYLETPGLTIETVFKKVRLGVMRETRQAQIPWESSSLLGDFYFAGKPNDRKMASVEDSGLQDQCQLKEVDKRPINCLFGETK